MNCINNIFTVNAIYMNKSHVSAAPKQKTIGEDQDDEQTIQDKM